MNEEMFQLWSDLETNRMLAKESQIDPWDSQAPEVQRVWTSLTSPERLDDLLDWERTNSPLNPIAQRMLTQAITEARSRQKGEKTTNPD